MPNADGMSVLHCYIQQTAAVEGILAISPKRFPLTLSGRLVCNSFCFCFVLFFLAVLDAAIQGNLRLHAVFSNTSD